MRNLLPIGRFSQITRLSIPALRHYDELGLLPPALIDPDTGYRYYSLSQAADADRIRVLRFLDMPLPEIREVLAAGGNRPRIRELLERHRGRLEGALERQRYAIGLLDTMLKEGPAMTYEVHLRETEPQLTASIRASVPWAEIGSFVPLALKEIWETTTAQGVRFAGPPYTAYFQADSSEADVELEVGAPVSDAVEPAGRVCSGTTPGGLVATTVHAGAYNEVGAAYTALGEWVTEHGHEMAGPPREVYIVGPDQAPDPGGLRTEIVWPIR